MSASSLADDLTARLARQIDLIAASLDDGGSRSDTEDGGYSPQEADSTREYADGRPDSSQSSSSLTFLSSALSRIRHTPSSSLSQLTSQVDAALEHQTELANGLFAAKNENVQLQQVQWILNAHLTVRAWGAVLRQLMDQAEKIRDEEDYWQSVASEDSRSLLYIVQSTYTLGSGSSYGLCRPDSPLPPAENLGQSTAPEIDS